LFPLHANPLARFGTHEPPRQKFPAVHCESTVQPPLQKFPEQVLGEQASVWTGGQLALLPVQFAGSVAIGGGPGLQLGPRH